MSHRSSNLAQKREINKKTLVKKESLDERAIISTPSTLRGMWLNKSFMTVFEGELQQPSCY
jgi:hypothetical protein